LGHGEGLNLCQRGAELAFLMLDMRGGKVSQPALGLIARAQLVLLREGSAPCGPACGVLWGGLERNQSLPD